MGSAKGKRAKSGKDANTSTPPSKNPTAGVVPSSQPSSVPSTQSPCPNSVVLNDNNAKDWFNVRQFTDYSSDKEAIKCFDTSQVTNMDDLLNKSTDEAITNDLNADISSWDVSSVTTMRSMFTQTKKFNRDVSDWDVSSVTDMRSMFSDATKFNGDVSDWDVSSVTNMREMFKGTTTEFNGGVPS